MTRGRRVAFIVASALAGFGAGALTASRPPPSSLPPTNGAIAESSASQSVAVASKRSGPSNAPAPAMPEPGVPLAESYSALATRAESGDREAAERLVSEVEACRRLPWLRRRTTEDALRIFRDRDITEGPYAPAAAADLAAFEERNSETASTIETQTRLCAGIGEHRLSEFGHWLYQAGELGDAKAAHRFGSGGWISISSSDTLDEGAIEFWRAHALEMTERALAGGELSASVELALSFHDVPGLAYLSDDGSADYLYTVLPRDPVRSAAYLRVADMIGVCRDCTSYAVQMEYDTGGTTAADARAEAERICTTELAGRCANMAELLAR